jgi:hypothetical protein
VKYKLKNEGSAKYELAVLVTLHCAVADMLISKNKSAFIRFYTHQGTPCYSYLVGISYIVLLHSHPCLASLIRTNVHYQFIAIRGYS